MERPIGTLVALIIVSLLAITFDLRNPATFDPARAGAVEVFGPPSAVVRAGFDPMFSFFGDLQDFPTLREQNEALLEEVNQLRGQAADIARLEAENDQLRALVGLQSVDLGAPGVAAEVEGQTDDGAIIISVGTVDGVVLDNPVVDSAGRLVGKVTTAGENRSLVTMLPALSDAVTIVTPQGVLGSVVGINELGEVRLDIASNAGDIPPGSILATAGRFGYPEGIQVAVVEGGIDPQGDQIIDARIRPVVDFRVIPQIVQVLQFSTVEIDSAEEEETDG